MRGRSLTHLIDQDRERLRWPTEPADLEVGVRRARAAALLTLALPGVAYIYQGDELGLRRSRTFRAIGAKTRPGGSPADTDPGRDGCRVPLPWSGVRPPFGFSPDDASSEPWLPQPPEWASVAAEAQADDGGSVLMLYAEALRIRQERLAHLEPLTWLETPPGALAFTRAGVQCWVNTGPADVPLPKGQVLIASAPGPEDGVLGSGTAAWLAVA